jgi:cytochrome c553
MQHTIILRAAIGLAMLFAAAALGFAWITHRGTGESAVAATDPDGDALFLQRCARCHERTEILAWLERRPDATRRESDLAEFLRSHRKANENENERIAAAILRAAGHTP